jgi:hypothetical protein
MQPSANWRSCVDTTNAAMKDLTKSVTIMYSEPHEPVKHLVAHEDQIRATLAYYHGPGDCFEVCGIGTDRYPKAVDGGFFDNHESAVKAAVKLTGDHHAVYVTINPVNRALLGRASNRIKQNLDRTADKEVPVIRWLPVDIDPVRPAKISSSDAEHQAAIDHASL